MKRLLNHQRWIALAGLTALLFMQTAAAAMACQQRAVMAGADMAQMGGPCPMTPDLPAPLCTQQCTPDENKGQAIDLPVAAPAPLVPALAAGIETASATQLLHALGADRETGPPLFLVFLRLLLP